MTITRDIVIDLLPLYVSGEASADTCAVVKRFLDEDASLAALMTALRQEIPPVGDAPSAIEREAVNRTRRVIAQRSWTLGLGLMFTLLPLSFVFRNGEMTFFMLRDQPQSAWFWAAAVFLWMKYFQLTRRLKTAGLS